MRKKKVKINIMKFICKMCGIETDIQTDYKIKIRDLCVKCFRKKYKNTKKYIKEKGKK